MTAADLIELLEVDPDTEVRIAEQPWPNTTSPWWR